MSSEQASREQQGLLQQADGLNGTGRPTGCELFTFEDGASPTFWGGDVSPTPLVIKVTGQEGTTAQNVMAPPTYRAGMMSNPQDSRVATRQFADFRAPPAAPEPLLRDWLAPHHDTLFRWTIARAGSADDRRALAEVAVAIQRLRGSGEFVAWLFGVALQAAHQLGSHGGLDEASLTGLPPELRALLRLVARKELRAVEAMALLAQRMGYVRGRLVRTRLGG